MEILKRFGTEAQKEQWLKPLLLGEIRSVVGLTEPDTASSDLTNLSTTITREGEHYVINGRKWFSTGAKHPNARLAIVFASRTPTRRPTVTRSTRSSSCRSTQLG